MKCIIFFFSLFGFEVKCRVLSWFACGFVIALLALWFYLL